MIAGLFRVAAVCQFAALLSVQCIASCGPGQPVSHTDDNLPPCHRHQQSPVQQNTAPCCHDSMVIGSDQVRVDLTWFPISALPAVSMASFNHIAEAAISTSKAASPPDLVPFS